VAFSPASFFDNLFISSTLFDLARRENCPKNLVADSFSSATVSRFQIEPPSGRVWDGEKKMG
jgi:hypothetical protein